MCYLAVYSMAVTHILHKSYGIRTSLRKTNTSIIHQEIEQFFLFIIIKIAFLPTVCARQQMTRYSILQGALGDTILFNNVTSTQGAVLVGLLCMARLFFSPCLVWQRSDSGCCRHRYCLPLSTIVLHPLGKGWELHRSRTVYRKEQFR